MPYELPTQQQFRLRHKDFMNVDSDLITSVISEASRRVDLSWNESDYQPAIMLLAAHMLMREGVLGDDVSLSGPVISEKTGDAQTTYANTFTANTSDYETTIYGKEFRRLQKLNVPRFLTI